MTVKLHLGVLVPAHGLHRCPRQAWAGENWRAGRAALGKILGFISDAARMAPGRCSHNGVFERS